MVFLGHGLNGVAQQLTDDVLEVTKDVRESGIHVASHFDLWELHRWGCFSHQVMCNSSASFDDLFGFTLEENLTNEVCVHIGSFVGVREVPGFIESICES
jgi:hypothetical protein